MSTLLVDEMYPGVQFEQLVKIDRNINIAHIRPWIYLHGTLADGDFKCEILQGTTVLASTTISSALINTTKTVSYSHGFLRFDFDALTLNVSEGNTQEEYKIRFSMINHTKDTNNFLGLVRNWDLKIYSTYGTGVTNNQAINDSVEPVGLEIYEYNYI